MIDKLKKEENKLQNFIKEWDKYVSSDKKHYNIPLPYEVEEMRFNYKLVYDDGYSLSAYEAILSYLNIVCDYYDNNDYVVNLDYCMGKFHDKSDINKVKITEEHREYIKRIRDGLEHHINRMKS